MNTKRIEGKGVNAVNGFILNTQTLMPYIDFNDRTDSWDGNIFVYSSEENRKKELIGKIPIQVKASEVKLFSGIKASKQIDVSDIYNYKSDGGVILFFVECLGEKKHIYYNPLLPVDLENIIKQLKINQKKVNISFDLLNVDDLEQFEIICEEFCMHRKKQYSIEDFEFPQEKLKKMMLQGVMKAGTDFEKMLLSKVHYIYGTEYPKSPTFERVGKINFESIIKHVNKRVSINGIEYYQEYEVERFNAKDIIRFNKNVIITLSSSMVNITYNDKGTLDERINDTEFLFNLIEKGEITLQGKQMKLINSEIGIKNEAYMKWKNRNTTLTNIAALLDIFGIDHMDFDVDSLDDNNTSHLKILVDSMVLNHSVPEQKKMPGVYRLKIGLLNVLVVIEKNKQGKVIVHDFNSYCNGNFIIYSKDEKPEEGDPASFYLLLEIDDIINCCNIRLKAIYEDVIRHSHSNKSDELTLLFVLKIIHGFDIIKDEEFLKYADKLLNWLMEGDIDKVIIKINKLQIARRRRKLNNDEIEELVVLKRLNSDNFLLCGINILLEDCNEFEKCFNKLSKEKQKRFREFPIYSLRTK